MHLRRVAYVLCVLTACGGGGETSDAGTTGDGPFVPLPDAPIVLPLPQPVCAPGSGAAASAQTPVLATMLAGVTDESWLGSPSVVDLDNDTLNEIVVPRDTKLVVWRPNGTIKWQKTPGTGRIWASPVVMMTRVLSSRRSARICCRISLPVTNGRCMSSTTSAGTIPASRASAVVPSRMISGSNPAPRNASA